jgi:transposase
MRLKITQSKNNEFLSIIKSFRVGPKSTSKIVQNLGSMKQLLPLHHHSRDEVIAWANDLALQLTREEKANQEEILVKYSQSKRIPLNQVNSFNGGYLFLQKILSSLGVQDIAKQIKLDSKVEYPLEEILSKLIYARILYPSSKLSSFKQCDHFLEKKDFDLHEVYRSLDLIAQKQDFIQSELYHHSLKMIQRNTQVLYYDCTNFFFDIQEADGLKQYGKSKENRPNPIVQMGLFMDGNGLPLSFSLQPGNQNEQISLKPLEEQMIKDFKLSSFVVCTDAGLGSIDNRKFNNFKQRSYIVTQSLKQLKSHLQDWILEKEGWSLAHHKKTYSLNEILSEEGRSLYQDKIFYKERWINENGLEQRLIVSFSLKYYDYQRSVRQSQIDRAMKMVEKQTVALPSNPNSSKRFIQENHVTDKGEVAESITLSLDEEKILKEERFDGYYGVCTTLEDPVETILKINKHRWEIEESFRIMKSEFKSRPVYLRKDNRIESHFMICFIALLVFRILEKKLNEAFSAPVIIQTLRDLNFKEIVGEGYIPTYTRTDLTDQLHEVFGFRTDSEITSSKTMKKIIKLTKKP